MDKTEEVDRDPLGAPSKEMLVRNATAARRRRALARRAEVAIMPRRIAIRFKYNHSPVSGKRNMLNDIT